MNYPQNDFSKINFKWINHKIIFFKIEIRLKSLNNNFLKKRNRIFKKSVLCNFFPIFWLRRRSLATGRRVVRDGTVRCGAVPRSAS